MRGTFNKWFCVYSFTAKKIEFPAPIDMGAAVPYISLWPAEIIIPPGHDCAIYWGVFMLGLSSIAKRFFGSSNDRKLRSYNARLTSINALEADFEQLDDASLKGKTQEFKTRLIKGETLDDILEEAFAAVREAARRTLGQRHYDVQMIGGMVLHDGAISEMKTGEGKRLLPPCHVI